MIPLKLNNKRIQKMTSLLCLWIQSSIPHSKNPMPWELINHHQIHLSESVMEAMFCHKTLTGLPKHCPKTINEAPCTVCSTSNMNIFSIGRIVDTTSLIPGELLHTYFFFYNFIYIQGFTSMLTVVCTKTIMLWF